MSYILYMLNHNFLVPLVYHGLPLFYNLSNFFLNVGVSVLFSKCTVTSFLHHEGGVRYQGEYFLHIGTSVLLLFSYCRVLTSSFHHEGGVCYQGEYFLHIGTSVLLLVSNCRVLTN